MCISHIIIGFYGTSKMVSTWINHVTASTRVINQVEIAWGIEITQTASVLGHWNIFRGLARVRHWRRFFMLTSISITGESLWKMQNPGFALWASEWVGAQVGSTASACWDARWFWWRWSTLREVRCRFSQLGKHQNHRERCLKHRCWAPPPEILIREKFMENLNF